MNNLKSFNKLGRKTSHRKALHRNMVASLIKHERIKTTAAKAKEIRRTAEKLVTRAKMDSVHNRRMAAKTLYEKNLLNKLFMEVGPRFVGRPGGYTRIMKTGYRSRDSAEMVILEFLPNEEGEAENKAGKRKSSRTVKGGSLKKSASRKTAAGVDAEKGTEAVARKEVARNSADLVSAEDV